MSTSYPIQAINLYDSINIKASRSLLTGKVIDSSPQEMQLEYGENSYLFIYRFGCLVFFNMSPEQIEKETSILKAAMGEGLAFPTTESHQIILSEQIKVEFEHVELKKLSRDYLRLVAMTIGQSAALEYFEIRAERMLHDTAAEMEQMGRSGMVPFSSRQLVKRIGSTASARQNIISNLAILDPPEETWKSKDLEKFYKDLQANFDIEIRFRVLDRKLSLIQDNIEILSDLASKSRSNILELLIVILIVAELLIAFFRTH
jgi:uncharacterized Rmd1/YagE family protein